MSSKSTSHITLYTDDRDNDKLLMSVLISHYAKLKVVSSIDSIGQQLKDPAPKVIMVAASTFQETISIYYQALDAVHDKHLCEHSIVSLISRHDEKEAYQAFSSGLIDDYLVARPLYELHRPIVICSHLLKELGLTMTQKDGLDFVHSQDYSPDVKSIVTKGLVRKNTLKQEFESSIDQIDKALDKAAERIQANQTVQLDLKRLDDTLSAIRSDEIRPELLKLQSKAINLLQQVVSDVAEEHQAPAHDTKGLEQQQIKKKNPNEPSFNRLHNTTISEEEIEISIKHIPKVLIVEDDNISLNLTVMLLKHYKIDIDTAVSGRRAFAYLNSRQYDLVLMDINLPDTNGLYLLNQVAHGTGPNRDTPIIMLTGNKNKNTVKQAVEEGAKGYIIKPLYKATMIKLFEKYNLPLFVQN